MTDDPGQRDAALGGQHAAEDGRRLAREDEAQHHRRLGEDQHADERIGLPSAQRQEGLEDLVDHRASTSVAATGRSDADPGDRPHARLS